MQIIHTDILIIGAGAAGIRAAVEASRQGAGVVLVHQEPIARGGSSFSPITQGWGIQALVGKERTARNLESFYDDILRVGLGVCDPALVRILVEESGAAVEDLIAFGLKFKQHPDGSYFRARGCFSRSERAFITADFANVQATFSSILRQCGAGIVTGTAFELLVADGECHGAWVQTVDGDLLAIDAGASILATGGGGGIFRHHFTSPKATGQGYGMAGRAGAKTANMEFIQFMLGIKENDNRRFFPLGELSRPNVLCNDKGQDILSCYIADPVVRDKAARERQHHCPVSSRDCSVLIDHAVAAALDRGGVFWRKNNDQKPSHKTTLNHFAHAFNGGIRIDTTAQSTLPGLFAAGEAAAGPHGADRIGGCMLTATQVFAKRAGKYAAGWARRKHRRPDFKKPALIPAKGLRTSGTNGDRMEDCQDLLDEIRRRMQTHVVLQRSDEGLSQTLTFIGAAEKRLAALDTRTADEYVLACRLGNLCATARLVVSAALARKTSMGAHDRVANDIGSTVDASDGLP
jgi:fumarate reductase (CoM/CoB) subunit A